MMKAHGNGLACYRGDRPESGSCAPCKDYRRHLTSSWRARHPERSRQIVRDWYARNGQSVRDRRTQRASMLAMIKLEAGCVDCGYSAHPEALDFDHVSGTKEFGIGSGTRRTAEALLDEIEKCVVRCANCHRIKTRTERVGHMKRRVLGWE